MSAPNAGITKTSTQMSGGPYANGQVKVTANNAGYATQWYAYMGPPPPVPIWHDTNYIATCAPGSWMVMLKANTAVTWNPAVPTPVTVAAGYQNVLAVTYT